jgi:hypothetical protein
LKNIAIPVLACLALLGANAQADPSFDGSWVAEWKTAAGRPVSADLQLKDGNGSWRLRILSRLEDPCPKLAAPTSVQRQDAEVYLAVEYSKVLAGCRDLKLRLIAPPAEGVFKASFADGREITLTKQ